MKGFKVPIVLLGQQLDGYPCIFQDDYKAAVNLTEQMVKTGKKFGYITVTDKDEAVGRQRKSGVEKVLGENQITAFANIGKDLMPAEKRGSIGEVKPTGWQTAKYDNVDGKYLYNRCHLIGYQLTGENANEKNLITGTRYLNVDGMLPFENMVADYIKETNNHVLYRVTPVFSGDNLVASGVQMEAESVEDNGDGILFNVYCFNAQPGIAIDYATGDSHQDDSIVADASKSTTAAEANVQTYVLNTNTKKFHKESCNSAKSMDASNKKIYTGSRQDIIDMGYESCGVCKP